ncbi:kinase-like domain-containing protein [Glomus cerebriforme]|uniref:Kinase-like domain-containing protein n=1 Tax=Glomus cerebriforme TaxID=658196 RepID=A0A397SEC1_9GLOM|nr:kinase-like domain-containing protein [Glomus cerebriforme]
MNRDAQYDLGLRYENGIGIEKDVFKAFQCFKKAADNGSDEAQYKLGEFLEYGIGTEKNTTRAFYWYERAASKENKDAQYILGYCYENGIGIEKNKTKASRWFHKAAENNIKNAQYNLGLYYINGSCIVKDKAKAFYWYKKAAGNGDEEALFNLGEFFEYGIGTEKNTNRAFWSYQKAALKGNKDAQYSLELAEQGYSNAQNKLGSCYENGIGIEKDKAKAFNWYRKAGENGNIDVQYKLGLYYENGIGIEKNIAKAFYWYQKAAENGDKNAQYNSGLYYENGIGIEKNETKAFYWYQKSAENKNKHAQFNLGNCYENGIGIEKDIIKAFKLYKELAEQGYCNAQNKIWFFYAIGKGVEKDLEKATYWFKKAKKGSKNTIEWINNALKYEKIKLISYNELENATPLHTGGFGHITRAFWTKINNYVICKKLTNTTDIKHDLLDAFIHELKIHLHLDYSDRIIRCLGIGLALDGTWGRINNTNSFFLDPKTSEYLLIMQYANNGDLKNYLKNNFKNLTWDDKKKLAFQIANGLNYLHNENVLHRDLHSKNIVIHENNAKITDFGISKIQNDQNSTDYMDNFGVIAYLEPKRILDPNFPYTKSSDIYSFGVLMWEISSGCPPFKDNSDNDALAITIINGEREITIPNTPCDYEELYKDCWDREPEERPTINEILDKFEKMGLGIDTKNKLIKESINDKNNLTLELQDSEQSLLNLII